MIENLDHIWTAGKYIYFRNLGKGDKKTCTFDVLAAADATILGQVKWFARWRKYAFFPDGGMVFEETCLRDIASFCEQATKEHRELLTAARRERTMSPERTDQTNAEDQVSTPTA